jgi:DNA-binding MltR family transcriptional regulator
MKAALTKAQMDAIHRSTLEQNTNRADAITWACQIEQALQVLLRTGMIVGPEVDKLFDDSDGPLSSFAAQIKCAWAIGLIDGELRKDLDCIRKVRNRFAHENEQTLFSSSPVREWFRQLSPVKHGRVIVTEFSRSEYTKVVFEIQLTLMALVWQRVGIEGDIEQARSIVREIIGNAVDAVVPPSASSSKPMG